MLIIIILSSIRKPYLIVIFSKACSCQTILKKRRVSKYLSRSSHFSSHSPLFSLLYQKRVGELNRKKKKFQRRNRYFGFLYRSIVLILSFWSNFKAVIQFPKESIIEMVRYGNKGNYRRYKLIVDNLRIDVAARNSIS